jgi:hypothetical protein
MRVLGDTCGAVVCLYSGPRRKSLLDGSEVYAVLCDLERVSRRE